MIGTGDISSAPYYEAAGRHLAAKLGRQTSLVIAGDDPDAAGLVALGFARALGDISRVCIADLTGGAAPLEALVSDDDPHGVTDCFEYGVALSRVEREVAGDPRLRFLRTGADPRLTEAMLRHPRWRRFADGLAVAGGLLILVTVSASDAESLLTWADGVILVGRQALSVPALVLGRVRTASAPVVRSRRSATVVSQPAPEPWRTASICAAALVLMGIAWIARSHDVADDQATDAATATERAAAVLAPDSPLAVVTNRSDSAGALRYGIEVVAVNTELGALGELERMPAISEGTVATSIGTNGVLWYRVVLGACATERAADSLLRALQASGTIDARTDRVVQVPYALLLTRTAADSAARLADTLRAHRVAAYVLHQTDGAAKVYVGAFSTDGEARLAASALRANGMSPRIEYRTGRSC